MSTNYNIDVRYDICAIRRANRIPSTYLQTDLATQNIGGNYTLSALATSRPTRIFSYIAESAKRGARRALGGSLVNSVVESVPRLGVFEKIREETCLHQL